MLRLVNHSAIGLLALIVLCLASSIRSSLTQTQAPITLQQPLTSSNDVNDIVDEYRPDLRPFEDVYRDLHSHPELGLQEKRTAGIAADHLQKLGFDVIRGIGGHGMVGVLENGPGPTVLLRADMDALPIREQTGLPYASEQRAIDFDGKEKPVMHACGHDTHVTSLMAASSLLFSAKSKWSGTVIALFQPNEEHGAGAQAMVDDGLYKKVPNPEIVLGQHLAATKTGTVLVRSGASMAAADSFKATIFGKGGHGASPQNAIDPVLLAASIIVRLQSIVAREIAPTDIASLTIASIHGGETENVIPDEVELKINIRTFDPAVRQKVLTAMRRIIKSESDASGVLEAPVIERIGGFPPTFNDHKATARLHQSFQDYFGANNTWEAELATASEDVSILATSIDVPLVYWNFGGVEKEKWDEAEKEGKLDLIPKGHTAKYAPAIEPTLRTAVDAMALAALTFLDTTTR